MAYGAKYRLTFSDIYSGGKSYESIIYKKDYTGDIIDISSTGSPLTVETDRSGDISYRPIISTVATLNILVDENGSGGAKWEDVLDNWEAYAAKWDASSFDFREFIVAGVDDFYLEVKMSGGIIWRGYYITNSDTTISEISPITMSLKFSDFTLAKVNRYHNFSDSDATKYVKFPTNNRRSLLDVFARCAYYAYNSTTIAVDYYSLGLTNTYKLSSGTQSINLWFDNMYVQDNAFFKDLGEYDSCYSILEGICKQYGLMAYFKNDILYITSYDNLLNKTSRTYKTYDITSDSSYTYINTITENDSVGAVNDSTFKNVGKSQSIKFNYPYRNVIIKNDQAKGLNIPNCFMNGLQSAFNVDDTIFYLNRVTSDKAGYYELGTTRLDTPATTISKTGDGLIAQWLTASGSPNANVVIAGTYALSLFIDRSGSGSDTKLYAEAIKYSSTNVVTVIATTDIFGWQKSREMEINIPETVISTTDRIGLRVYATNNTGVTVSIRPESKINDSSFAIGLFNSATPNTGKYYVLPGWYRTVSGSRVKNKFYPTVDTTNDFRVMPFSPYSKTKTSSSIGFSTKVYTSRAFYGGFSTTNFIDSEPLSVKAGDLLYIGFSAFRDATLQNITDPTIKENTRAKTEISLLFKPSDQDAAQIDRFYNDRTKVFRTTNQYLNVVESTDGDIERLKYDSLEQVVIPEDGEVRIRMYRPYNGINSAGTTMPDNESLFLEYFNLQSFTSSPKSNFPKNQSRIVNYNNIYNSNEDLILDSNLLVLDGKKYVSLPRPSGDGGTNTSPIYMQLYSCNAVVDEYNSPASGLAYDYTNLGLTFNFENLQSSLDDIGVNIQNNIGLVNASIDGTYKSDIFFIGKKFTHQVIGYDTKTFCLLDYRIDFKNATQDSVLYSSEFSDTTGLVVTSQTIIK